jgi:hypothetical protein
LRGPNLGGGLGDLPNKGQDAMETFFDIGRQGAYLSRQRYIVAPDWHPPQVAGGQVGQQILEEHLLPRLWQLLSDHFLMLQRGMYFVKGPNWHEAPVTAENLDLRNETPVAIPATGVATLVWTYTVPDRFIGSILALGHALGDPLYWGLVTWNILVNGRPASVSFQSFLNQIGQYHDPTKLASPIRLKPEDVVEVYAANAGANPVNAYFRAKAFMFPATKLTSDGSFAEYKTL